MDKAFVTGWPIAHSRSPLIHNHWIEKYGLDGKYEIRACTEAELPDFIRGFDREGYAGGNVTLPHKEAAFTLMEHTDSTAKAIRAVNTIWHENGSLCGINTDVFGFLANLDEIAPSWDSDDSRKRGALVLGAGGSSRAIIYGLLQRGFDPVWIANRTISRAERLSEEFGSQCQPIGFDEIPKTASQAALVVNCTSLGMGDGRSPIDLAPFRKDIVVNDIVYAPLITPMLEQAKALGMKPVDGLGMLLHQAVPGFEKWFGIRPEVTDELRALVIHDLGENT